MPAAPRSQATRRATTIIASGGRVVSLRVLDLSVQVVGGADQGVAAALSGRELAIGADPSNHLVLNDASVSRFHCRIVADGAGYRVIDAGSANGTFLNGVRVRDAFLPDPARLEVGGSQLAVSFGDTEREIELSAEEHFGEAIGRGVAMRELFALARRAAQSTATVLILGETGTGKDLIARAIHASSARAAGPFVVFDGGAVAPTLIESELFGHVRGAFTGADAERPGVFERAHGGTLFLDEIGELDVALQPKLLRAIETGTATRVGATQPVRFDVRIIAATNRDLRAEVDAGRFRSDLFYRLAVILLQVPPLRERVEDIPLLAAHFLEKVVARDQGDVERLRAHTDSVFGGLARWRWPGNVRELRNVVERAVALADPKELGKDVFSRMVELRTSITRSMRVLPPLKEARDQLDREYLRDVLAAAGGDAARAAEMAQVHPKSFARLLRRYGIGRGALALVVAALGACGGGDGGGGDGDGDGDGDGGRDGGAAVIDGGGADAGGDPDCWPTATTTPAGTIEVGVGDPFEPFEDEGPVTLTIGPQGGVHIEAQALMTGLEPGNPEDPGDPGNPFTLFTVTDEEGTELGAITCAFRIAYDPDEDVMQHAVALFLRNDQVNPSNAEDRLGTRIHIEVEIIDADLHYASNEHWVVVDEVSEGPAPI
ncbi:MAG TPA: sigma 54-interacting transcriptional regulator [Kofleriaceae bacterium]|nr:sigma 54-interacting transcriptional regulator [Kofleriaceae bacterium]